MQPAIRFEVGARTFGALLVAFTMACLQAVADEAKPGTTASKARLEAYEVTATGQGGAVVRLYGQTVGENVVDRGSKPFLWRLAGP